MSVCRRLRRGIEFVRASHKTNRPVYKEIKVRFICVTKDGVDTVSSIRFICVTKDGLDTVSSIRFICVTKDGLDTVSSIRFICVTKDAVDSVFSIDILEVAISRCQTVH